MISITRRYHFAASHRLHSPSLSAAENRELYGKCNNPFGHGHDYILEVTAAGEEDTRTGLLMPIPRLDQLVQSRVLRLFAYRNINADIPQFESLAATTENIALVIADLLQEHWRGWFGDSSVRLQRVRVQETERNSFEILLSAKRGAHLNQETESVTINA